MFYRCAKCKLYLAENKTCQIMIPAMRGKINPEDYCSKCVTEISVCEKCGGGVLVPIVEVKDDTVHIYCQNCINTRNLQEDARIEQEFYQNNP